MALALGVTDHEISWRLVAGRLEEMHPGVYYLNSTDATWKTEVLAAVLAAGPHSVVSHRCAAVLWGLEGVIGRMIEMTVPFNDSPAPKGALVHRTRRVIECRMVEGIPVSTPERTVLDLAWSLPERTLEKVVASVIRKRLATVDSIAITIARLGGRGVRGTRKARRVLRLVECDSTGSVSEVDMSQLIRDAPIPVPIQQLRIPLPTGGNAYPDFAWPDRRRIVEVDGFDAHGTPEQLQHDLARQNQLLDMGWEIRRFTASDVRRNAATVIAEVIRFVNQPFCAD